MITISCSGKLHAFALAEQMDKEALLDAFYTTYASEKNTFLKQFVKRYDKEMIPAEKIKTITVLAFPIKLWQSEAHIWNNLFDGWVARRIRNSNSKVFIGWSGMSLKCIRQAKKRGMITVLERGSSHILVQNRILKEEYARFNKEFSIHPVVIKKEIQEYEETDYISVPSFFVRDSFIDQGIKEERLLVNPFGANKYFAPESNNVHEMERKFRIVYLGSLSIRKGLIYLFQAITRLSIPLDQYEVWFIGNIDREMKPFVDKYKKDNWTFFGHINHYDLKDYLISCDVGIQPSLEEGLSMVIPQMMACGVPVIITPNTGGENILKDGISGFVVPIRNPEAIADKINLLFDDKERLSAMKISSRSAISAGFTWDDYGKRYVKNILNLVKSA